MFPAMERSLDTSRPTSAQLSLREANVFLTEAAPLLQESGFGVILPDWWRGRSGRLKFGVKLRFKPPGDKKTGKNVFTMESIVEYDWRLSIGDQGDQRGGIPPAVPDERASGQHRRKMGHAKQRRC